MKVELLGLKTINKGCLVGTASVKINNIIINGVRITKTIKGLLVSMPSIVWIDNYQKYRKPAVELPKSMRTEISKTVLDGFHGRTKN